MSTLEHAVAIAAQAHAGQFDKAGEPYVLHPVRVMLQMDTNEERIVAVLHDVVEDTDWTLQRLRKEGFSNAVIAALDSVTRRTNETYGDFVDRAGQNPIGRRVKLADLEDNADLARISQPTEADRSRVAKYREAIARLKRVSPKPAA